MNGQVDWTSAERLYGYVMQEPSIDARLKRSLCRIRTVCDEIGDEALSQSRRGVKFSLSPIYVAEVGRRCVKRYGGPSGSSITRNRAKEPLKAMYIELRSSELLLPGVEEKQANALAGVKDAALRAYVRTLESKLKITEQMNDALSEAVKRMRPIELDAAIRAMSEAEDTIDLGAGAKNFDYIDLVGIIRRLMDPLHLASFGLLCGPGIYNPATGVELISERDVGILNAFLRAVPEAGRGR